jgi:2-oxo-4-hydroxy-4-carboxy-5-ureidoimidazoline decarboxylase
VIDIEGFNRLPDQAAAEQLRGCCSADRWIAAVASGRPYGSVEALCARSGAAVAELGEAGLRAALDGHPRLGDRPVGGSASSREQAALSASDAAAREALAAGNAAYEQRFGHIYLACATGRSAAELAEFLRRRLGNDRAAEWRVVAAELAKINQLRLRKLVGQGDEHRL